MEYTVVKNLRQGTFRSFHIREKPGYTKSPDDFIEVVFNGIILASGDRKKNFESWAPDRLTNIEMFQIAPCDNRGGVCTLDTYRVPSGKLVVTVTYARNEGILEEYGVLGGYAVPFNDEWNIWQYNPATTVKLRTVRDNEPVMLTLTFSSNSVYEDRVESRESRGL